MMFIHFLEDNPVIDGFIVLVLLITVVPAGMGWYRRRHPPAETEQADVIRQPRESRFLGTQMDLAILVIGLLLLLALIHWIRGLFS
ncbi:MAG TPA: hypothetical protein VNH42_05845 [Mariprofundaceae bacterium]|nr:hypothetical protein [Mariprofundaceae bacterium]